MGRLHGMKNRSHLLICLGGGGDLAPPFIGQDI